MSQYANPLFLIGSGGGIIGLFTNKGSCYLWSENVVKASIEENVVKASIEENVVKASIEENLS